VDQNEARNKSTKSASTIKHAPLVNTADGGGFGCRKRPDAARNGLLRVNPHADAREMVALGFLSPIVFIKKRPTRICRTVARVRLSFR